MRDLAGGLLPDLGAGGAVVGEPVGVVRILVSVVEPVRMVAGQFSRPADGPVGTFVGVGPVHFRCEGVEDAFALRGDAGRHGELDGKADRCAEHGEGDAGVAAGGVEQGLTGREQAAGAGVGHHGGCGAVFDAAAGIGPLGLGQEGDAGESADDLVQADERGRADAFGE